MCSQDLSLLSIFGNSSSVKETFYQLRKTAFLLVQNSIKYSQNAQVLSEYCILTLRQCCLTPLVLQNKCTKYKTKTCVVTFVEIIQSPVMESFSKLVHLTSVSMLSICSKPEGQELEDHQKPLTKAKPFLEQTQFFSQRLKELSQNCI